MSDFEKNLTKSDEHWREVLTEEQFRIAESKGQRHRSVVHCCITKMMVQRCVCAIPYLA